MITTSSKPKEEKNKKGDSMFKQLLSGDFLFSKKAIRWYPYFIFLFLLIILIMLNEHSMEAKKDEVKKLETEYKLAVTALKSNNQIIDYDDNKKLVKILQEKGYVKNDKNCYKIVIKEDLEDEE